MDYSNQKLILHLSSLAKNIEGLTNKAGETLEKNVRKSVLRNLKTTHEYPFEVQNDFRDLDTIVYLPTEKAVVVKHPAAKRIEYGMPHGLRIKAKGDGMMVFEGRQGETVAAKEVFIKPTRPMGYVAEAIRDTKAEMVQRFKEVLA